MSYEFSKEDIKERIFAALVSNELEQTTSKDRKQFADPLAQTQNPLKANVFPAISQQLTQRGIDVKENEIEKILAETLMEKLSPKKGEQLLEGGTKAPRQNIERNK